MPIRLRDSNAILGRVRATLGDASAALAGTHVSPPGVAGSVSTRLEDVRCLMSGSFEPAAGRTGTIATTLQHFASSEFGVSQPPSIPDRTGTVAATLAGVTCSAAGTFTPVVLPQDSWFPNWPVMDVLVLQGDVAENLQDPAQWPLLADHSAFLFQGFYPTLSRLANRVTNISSIKATQTAGWQTKFGVYMSFQQARKSILDGNTDVQINLINSATQGNQNWWLRRVNGQQIEAPFNPAQFWMCNIGRGGGVNSLGETYHEAYWRTWSELLDPSDAAHDLMAHLSFFMQDDVHARMQTPMTINNGATTVTDPDIDDNGVADGITDFSSGPNAGCRKWCEGHIDSKAACESNFPGRVWFSNSARFPTDYTDSGVDPPLPMSGHPMYGRLTWGLQEGVNTAGLGITKSATSGASATYNYTGGGSTQHLCRLLAIHERMLQPDSQSDAGRACVIAHLNTVDRTQTAADYEIARLVLAVALLNERVGVSLSISASKPLSLDEQLLELGAPLAVRSMGTLNESTTVFTLRVANFSIGAARFYWAEFAKGLVILRGDSPSVGLYPSADAAVPCTLPSAGAGMKWQRINAATYTNPVTGRAMRGQQTSLNNGADITSVSLRPYHAMFIRRVSA